MKLSDALPLLLQGQYAKIKGWGWNEYSAQYGKDANGEFFWTAGGTCGGPLEGKYKEYALSDSHDYEIFDKMYGEPING